MFDIGFSELFLFGIIALIVLGPEKLPQAARTAGRWYAKIRRTMSTLQSEIEAELDLAETRQQMQDELARIRQTEADMRREMAEMRGNIEAFKEVQNPPTGAAPATDDKNTRRQNLTTPASTMPPRSVGDDPLSGAANHNTPKDPAHAITKPWENMWFRLGAYDQARRLPKPPYLPNHTADKRLNFPLDSALQTQDFVAQQESDQ